MTVEQIQRGEDMVFQAYDRRSFGSPARFDALIINGVTGKVTMPTNDDDANDDSETLLVAGAISALKKETLISAASGAYAVTLAAPDAASVGKIKVIRMSVAGNNLTLALTNIVGAISAVGVPVSTTATFSAVTHALVLQSIGTKWMVIGSSAVCT
jgi:hypothetical protein